MTLTAKTAYLRSLVLMQQENPTRYPYNLPAIRSLEDLSFHPQVTYICGENGTGKSTLMEAIAVAWGFNPEGGTLNFSFATRASHSSLHERLRLVRGMTKPRDGFFFRAESYYNLATQIEELDREPGGRRIIDSYGGVSLHEQSHGESFFAAFVHRFSGKGLYILDEPEAALSPLRQLSLLSRIHELVQQDSQFIIATHSPILMAYPESLLYYITSAGLEKCTLEQTEHYEVYSQFMTQRERMLKHLFEA
ncbi:AAA family ATPase [Paenibacillus sp. y28]|uniref:AAA family ATPase n=1 Tax=Paenibacillus sp. y28 TaxID=3129110 RepID=UPI00301683B9